MQAEIVDGDRVLTPAEVGTLLRVDPKTVVRWANQGKLSSFRTPGGHRRFWEREVRALMKSRNPEPEPQPETSA